MVKIRLSRFGKKHAPFYRIVVANGRSKREGEAIEYVGTYDPMTKPKTIKLEKEKIQAWLAKGAVPTLTVKSMLIREGVLKKDETARKFADKPGKKAQERTAKEAK